MKSRLLQAILVGLIVPGGADLPAAEVKLTASDKAAGDHFGTAVAISGEYAIVGAPEDDAQGSNSGSAYIFKREGTSWTQQATLTGNDGEEGDHFGTAVSISGDYALIGAFGDDDKGSASGSAYVFKRDGTSWAQQAKLLASDGEEGDRFGGSVGISGEYAIVGAYWDDDKGWHSGSAYVFKREESAWIQQQKLTASDGEADEDFAVSMSMSGDYAIVGVKYDDGKKNPDYCMAYVFKRTGTSWTQEAKLTRPDKAAYNSAGPVSVAISGDYAMVGVEDDDDHGNQSGSVYLFKREGSSWTQEAKLTASDGTEEDRFGASVAIWGDYAIIGAYGDDDHGSYSGSAYLFQRDGTFWTQQAKLTASDGAKDDRFGGAVALSGDYAMVGAQDSDEVGYKSDSGAVYIFKIDGPVSVASEIDTQVRLRPSRFALFQNLPNPFNPLTTIPYDLPNASKVTLILYTITGERVATLVSAYQEAGHYEVVWDGGSCATGVYLYRLEAEGFAETRRMVLIK